MIEPGSDRPHSHQPHYDLAYRGKQNTKIRGINDQSLEIALKAHRPIRGETEGNENENEQRIPAMITDREQQNQLHPDVPGIKRNHNENKNNFEAFNEVSLNSKVQAGLFEKSPSSTVKALQRKLD